MPEVVRDGVNGFAVTTVDDAVKAVAVTKDGARLLSASADKTVRTWNADGTPRAALTGHTLAVDGGYLAGGLWSGAPG